LIINFHSAILFVNVIVMCWLDGSAGQFVVTGPSSHHSAADIARSASAPTVSRTVKYLQARDTHGQRRCRSVGYCSRSTGHFHRSARLCFPAGRKRLLCIMW